MDRTIDGVVDPVRIEPELIRQRPPRSVRDAKPGPAEKPKVVKVKCRQVIHAGHAKTVPLTQAKVRFRSHTAKCQDCQHRMQCATA